ncbi:MAG: type I 3-dehydroquinate dehydratase [Eubacterium sp.]|nr:type I 3-dehydroquinate dehydratase [Eubacterium sp.]
MSTKVCVPVMGKTKTEVIEQAVKVVGMKPDMVEFRADYLEDIRKESVVCVAKDIKKIIGDIELVFTFRTKDEGGECEINDLEYKELCNAAAECCEYVDVEIIGHLDIANKMVEEIQKKGAKVIGSNHHFDKTPENIKITKNMTTMEMAGVDVCKIAVMPKDRNDVERFMEISKQLCEIISVPIITMSMGELGSVTRVCTDKTGSCVTFAAGVQASAPGQIDVHMARKLLKVNEGCILKGNIALIGFMGTGKTTISKALSKITGFQEIDVDDYIVKKAGRSITDIFEKEGEDYFRNLETEALKEISQENGKIISCGGGAVLRDENVEILKEGGVIILLTATPETIFDRVKDHTHRPILNSDMSLRHVKELMEKREPRYQWVADVKISVDANDRILTCYQIITELEELGVIQI